MVFLINTQLVLPLFQKFKDAQENLKNREEAFDQQAFNNFKIRFEAVLNQKTLFLEESHKKLQQLEKPVG